MAGRDSAKVPSSRSLVSDTKRMSRCRLAPIIAVDAHIVVAEVTAPDNRLTLAQPKIDAYIKFSLLEAGGGICFRVDERGATCNQLQFGHPRGVG